VLAGERADGQAVTGGADIREVVDAVDVDQRLRVGEPEVEEWDQALTAGEDLGSVTLGQQGQRLVEGARGVILEPRRLHRLLLPGQREETDTIGIARARVESSGTWPRSATPSPGRFRAFGGVGAPFRGPPL
jgi:hypothetical protein